MIIITGWSVFSLKKLHLPLIEYIIGYWEVIFFVMRWQVLLCKKRLFSPIIVELTLLISWWWQQRRWWVCVDINWYIIMSTLNRYFGLVRKSISYIWLLLIIGQCTRIIQTLDRQIFILSLAVLERIDIIIHTLINKGLFYLFIYL